MLKEMFTIVIQAGGESRRMGQDKALLPFLGQPLIERILKRISGLADEILVTTNNPGAFQFLGVPLYPDLVLDRGALGGLYTALRAASHPVVGIVACDMPFLNPDLLAFEREKLMETKADIVIPETSSGLEPFHAVYRRSTCLVPVKSALDAGKWRVDAWFYQMKLLALTSEEMRLYDPHLVSFWNVNTPEDLSHAQKMALEIESQRNNFDFTNNTGQTACPTTF
jgi:molybdopterin-guanine dinucleotide biosynthesis protein A